MDESITELMTRLREMSFSEFKQFIEDQDRDTLKDLKDTMDDLYYNTGEDTVQDYKYDYLKDYLVRVYKEKVKVGAEIRKGENRVQLPYWLGSMDKVYPEDKDVFKKWLSRNPAGSFVVSEKLDGVSCLIHVTDGQIKLYTRGDGTIGADISYLEDYIKGIPKAIKDEEGLAIRGELIMTKKDFEKYYQKTYKNARNLVSGIVNSKSLREGAKHTGFVAYEIVDSGLNPPIEEQLERLKSLRFKTAKYQIYDEIDTEILQNALISMKKDSEYEIDGIIVQANAPYIRVSSGNPDYAFAFKMILDDAIVETTVEDVEWKISKRGLLKPRLRLVPVNTAGVTITYATAFNAKYVWDNKLGPGSIVRVTRSGDVIPYIVEVVQGSDEPAMPEEISWEWNETHVDIIAQGDNTDMCIQLVNNFFTVFDIKFINENSVRRLFEGGLDTLMKIVSATPAEMGRILGDKTAARIYANMHTALQEIKLHKLMAASGLFQIGIGEKKLNKILVYFPTIFSTYVRQGPQEVYDKLVTMEGFSDKSAEKVVEGIPAFLIFYKAIKPYIAYKKVVVTQKRFKDMKIVMTGFRDKGMQDTIENEGGQVSTSVSKNTTLVVAANPNESSSKLVKARELGIPILSREEFSKKYMSAKHNGGEAPVEAKPVTKTASPKTSPKTKEPVSKISNMIIETSGTRPGAKLAIFDFDGTIVKPNGARPFPKDENDWTWFRPSVRDTIRGYSDQGYQVVIVTDQTKDWKIKMIKTVMKELDIPLIVVVGGEEEDKKPNTRHFLSKFSDYMERNTSEDFYVGDAAGRVADWSDVDKMFAQNLGIKFMTPEETFKKADMPAQTAIFHKSTPEIVIMTGLPASGKTYFATVHLGSHGYLVVDGDTYKSNSKKMIDVAKSALDSGSHQSVVFAATNLTKEKRKEFIDFAEKRGMAVRCFWLDSPIEAVLDRNKQREHPVPPIAIYTARKRLEPPEESEGCTVVRIFPDSGLSN